MFFVALMGLTVNNRVSLTWPEQFIRDVVSWVQGVASVPTKATADFFADWQEISNVHDENETLRKLLNKYAEDTIRLNQLETENNRLQSALKFTEEQKALHNYKYLYADVLSYSGDLYNKSIVINLGEKDGIKIDMAVASIDGLVGRIDSVSKHHSTVQLLVDLSSNNESSKPIAVAIKGKENQTFGVVEEFDRQKNKLRMSKIHPQDPMKKGDIVVTSGLGELFPSGLVIGKVTNRKVGDVGITHVADIKPAAKFNRLQEVFVIEVPIER
jgi:rod shape-determining protein MreC